MRPGLALSRPASGFLLGTLAFGLLIGLSADVSLGLNLLAPRLNLLLYGISSLLLGGDCLLTCSLFLGLTLLTAGFYLLSLGLSLLLLLLAHSCCLRLLRARALSPLL